MKELWGRWDKSDRVPLAQTLPWARAMQSLGAHSVWVFHSKGDLGGVLYQLESEPGTFHCQNGPILDWEAGHSVLLEQTAYFARTVAQFSTDPFRQLNLRPRLDRQLWDQGKWSDFPIEISRVEYASTIQIDLRGTLEELLEGFSSRMKRSLMKTFSPDLETDWRPVDEFIGPHLAESAQLFGKRRGFFVPPWSWFEALLKRDFHPVPSTPRLFIAEVRQGLSSARAWVWIQGGIAYFLYGDSSGPRLGSGVLLGAAVQVVAMLGAYSEGARVYDLNGYVRDLRAQPDYAGVAVFKSQFNGRTVDYAVPEWVISSGE